MNTWKETIRLDEAGFTLIEALVAMVVLTIGVFALYSMQVVVSVGTLWATVSALPPTSPRNRWKT